MSIFILLTAEQSNHVYGPSLQPVERQGGVFILNTLVLTDPAHEAHWEYLGALPQLDLGDLEFPSEIEWE